MCDLNPYFSLFLIMDNIYVETVIFTALLYLTQSRLLDIHFLFFQRINFKQLHAFFEVQIYGLPVFPGIVFHLFNMYVPLLPLRLKSLMSLFFHS